MIKSEATGKQINNEAEVSCMIVGNIHDIMAEYEAIMRTISRDPMLVIAADAVTTKLAKEHNINLKDLKDCFRPKSDSIDFINNILKEMKEND